MSVPLKFVEKFCTLVNRFSNLSSELQNLFSEKDTVTKFILPLIKSLGWNIFDIKEVGEEIYVQGFGLSIDRRVDCVTFIDKSPILIWEFKKLNTNIEFHYDPSTPADIVKSKTVGLQISKALGAKYFVISNFIQTIIWNPETETRIASGGFTLEDSPYYREYQGLLWDYLSKEVHRSITEFVQK